MTTSGRRSYWAIVLLLWPGLLLAQTRAVGDANGESARLEPGTSDDSPSKRIPKPLPAAGRSGTPLEDVKPGLFEIIGSTRLTPISNPWTNLQGIMKTFRGEPSPPQIVLLPLPLSYRDQVPLSFQLTVDPPGAVQSIDIYEDRPNNYVLKLVIDDVVKWNQVDVTFRSTILVGASAFDAVPASAPIPDAWPDEAQPWLAATWCADAKNERIQSLAAEIRAETSNVLEIIRRVETTADKLFRSASEHAEILTAVEALDKRGSCTSCANVVAALLRASGVPARVLSGYSAWSGPLQTHYLVEAYVPDYGWYPIESTFCKSPWPNTHQVNVAIIPPEYEQEPKARSRSTAMGGVPYLSLTEMPGNNGALLATGMVDSAKSCDHECRMIRKLQGTPEEWARAIAWAKPRWQEWRTSRHEVDADGQLRFSETSDEIKATSASALVSELGE